MPTPVTVINRATAMARSARRHLFLLETICDGRGLGAWGNVRQRYSAIRARVAYLIPWAAPDPHDPSPTNESFAEWFLTGAENRDWSPGDASPDRESQRREHSTGSRRDFLP